MTYSERFVKIVEVADRIDWNIILIEHFDYTERMNRVSFPRLSDYYTKKIIFKIRMNKLLISEFNRLKNEL